LQIYTTNISGFEEQTYWNKCPCNEIDALVRRHLLPTLRDYDPSKTDGLETEVSAMASSYLQQFGRLKTSTYGLVCKYTRPKILQRYRRAYSNLKENRIYLNQVYARTSAFVKYEKIPVGKIEARKPPRLIQYRSYEYLYMLKASLLQHDLNVKTCTNEFTYNGQSVRTIFTKLFNNYGVAEALRTNWDQFCDPVSICLDHSKFDGHYDTRLLQIEHKYWLSISSQNRLLKKLLDLQINQKGRTQGGISYKTTGHRMSGEYTTSSGNSLMNYAMLAQYCKASAFTKYRISVNGDDSVIFIESSELSKMLPLTYFSKFNMETECDRIVSNFQEITYCQSSPIRVRTDQGTLWYMCKTPIRSISRLCYSSADYELCMNRYRAGIGLCELAISSGIPVMQSVAVSIIQSSGLAKPLASVDRIPASKSGNKCLIRPVDALTRIDFELAFGISVEQQIDTESQLAGTVMSAPTFITLQNYLNEYQNFSTTVKNPLNIENPEDFD